MFKLLTSPNLECVLKFKTTIKVNRFYSTKLSYIHNVGKEPFLPLTMGQLLERTAIQYPDRVAITSCHQKKSYTFQQVLTLADKLAAGLRSIGLEKGDRVGLWAPNLAEWYIAKMACLRGGYLMAGLNPSYQPLELEYCVNKIGIKTVICGDKFRTQDYYAILESLVPNIGRMEPGKTKSDRMPSLNSVISISDQAKPGTFTFEETLDFGDEDFVTSIQKNQDSISMDDPCNIQFTSGTTGKAKAAITTHFTFVNNAYLLGKRNELDQKYHKICVQVPLFHAFGTVITITAALNFGSTLVLPTDGYNPNKTLNAIKNEKCTVIHGTPTMYIDLVHRQEMRQEDISPEIAIWGGAICPEDLFRKMKRTLNVEKVKSVYGLSETTAVIFQSLHDDREDRYSTVGKVSEHIEVKVIDENDRTVPFGTPGELCVRGYCNMLGYWEDEDKTREIITPSGWLKTGDQFVLYEDGYGKVVGRIKEMINRGGEKIMPREVEDLLSRHPSVLEVAVVGIPHERLGEEVCACLRIKPGTSITHDNVVKFCEGEIAYFKIPSKIQVLDQFPKTLSGKIQKFKLVELCR